MSLRQAVAAANAHAGPDTINFAPGLLSPPKLYTIALLQGQITFSDTTGATTLLGPGAGTLAVNGGFVPGGSNTHTTRVLRVAAGASVSISGITITGGQDPNPDGSFGGGIQNAGTLTLNGVTVSGNQSGNGVQGAGNGGGIYSTGALTLVNSTISSNSAIGTSTVLYGSGQYVGYAGSGGGIFSSGTLTIFSTARTPPLWN
jgi:fibronectin-binding autotransporter adhesin